MPRFESRMIDGNGSGGAVNPFAYSPPNPFLSRLGGGGHRLQEDLIIEAKRFSRSRMSFRLVRLPPLHRLYCLL